MKVYHPTLAEIIKKDGPLNEAEAKFVDCCKTGKEAVFGNELPTEATNANTIRANLIRLAMLGGCAGMSVGPKGVQIQGAWITEVLDLRGCESKFDLVLGNCKICEQPIFQNARLGSVMLPGSTMPGLGGNSLTVKRNILLNRGFKATRSVDLGLAKIGGTLDCSDGAFNSRSNIALNLNSIIVSANIFLFGDFTAIGEVNLGSARVTGQLDCSGGSFDGAGSTALDCDAIIIGADVFLCGTFKAIGEVNLSRAQIAGQLACDGGKFSAINHTALTCCAITVGADVLMGNGFTALEDVNLARAQITGNLMCSNAAFKTILNCKGVTVGGGFFWEQILERPLICDLTDAHVGSLRDDKASWEDCTPVLNGFRYDRILSDMSVRDRLDWLDKVEHKIIPKTKYLRKETEDVQPQPYTQLASVFEAAGQRQGAALVRYEREQRVRPAENAKRLVEADSPKAKLFAVLSLRIKGGIDRSFGWSFGYGHRPMLVFRAILLIWLFSVTLYGYTYDRGQMAPNSAVILTSVEWRNASIGYTDENRPPKPAEYTQNEWVAYTSRACLKKEQPNCTMPLHLWEASKTSTDYETFNRYLYALDLFVPLDALGQENAWAPSKDRGWWGWWAYSLRWVIQMLGWIITAIGAAALTGVIGRKE